MTTRLSDFGVSTTGNVTAGGNVVTGGIKTDGYYYANGTPVSFSANVDLTNVTSNIIPAANVTYSLGNATNQWKDLWISNNTIFINSIPLSVGNAGTLTFDGNEIVTSGPNVINTGNVETTGDVIGGNLVIATGGGLTFADGTVQTSAYGDANVASYLPTYTGNLGAGILTLADVGNNITSVVQRNQNPPLGSEAYGIELLTTVNDDAAIYSSVSAGPDYTAIKSSNAGNADVIAQGGYGVTIQTSNVTGGSIKSWSFLASGNTLTPGNVSVNGTVTANYFAGDGSQLTNITAANITGAYGNANVAEYLPTYTGNLNNVGGVYSTHVSVSGNVTTDTLYVNTFEATGNLSVAGNVTTGNLDASNLFSDLIQGNTLRSLGNISASGTVNASGNVSGNYIFGNGSQLTGLASNNTIISINSELANTNANVSASANAIANLQATSYSNANVASYLPIYTGNIQAGIITANTLIGEGGNISNITGANVTGEVALANTVSNPNQPNITALGTITSLTANAINLDGLFTANGNAQFNQDVYFAGNVTLPGNIIQISGNSGSFFGDPVTGFGALYAGLPAGYTLLNNEVVQFSDNYNSYAQVSHRNINGGSQATTDFVATADNGTDTANFIDLGVAGSGYDGLLANNSLGTSLYANDGYLYTKGNIGGGNLVLGSNQANGVVRIIANGASNIGDVVATFSSGQLSVAGNVTATNIIGNGSQLTNIAGGNVTGTVANATNAQAIINGTSSIEFAAANANIEMTVGGTGIVNASATTFAVAGNITANTISTVGNITSAGWIQGAAIDSNGYVSGQNFYVNGTLVTYGNSDIGGNVVPSTDLAYSLGNATNRFNAYLGNVTTKGITTTEGNVYTESWLVANNMGVEAYQLNVTADANVTGNLSASYAVFNDIVLNDLSTNAILYTDSARNVWNTDFSYDAPNNTMNGGNVSVTGNVSAVQVNATTVATNTIMASGGSSNVYIDPLLQGFAFVQIPTFQDGGEQLIINNHFNSSDGIYLVTETGSFHFLGNSVVFPDGSTQSTAYTGYGDGNVVSLMSSFGSNTVSTTGNVSAGYFYGDGSNLTGLPAGYSDSNVTTLLASYGSNTISTTGNITSGTFVTSGSSGNISGANYIGANYFVGDGSLLTNLPVPTGSIGTMVSGPNITPAAANSQYNVTALAETSNVDAPTGSPADAHKLTIRIIDNGIAQSLTWDPIYQVIGTTLPTTTVAGKYVYIGVIYNAQESTWDVVSVAQQA